MEFTFISEDERAFVVPQPIAEENYDAWAKVHYGLMKHLTDRHPQFKVSSDPSEPTELYYLDDWFEIRKTAVVAMSWRAFCLPVAQSIQRYLATDASDWLVTFAVEGGRELEIGCIQLEILISMSGLG